MEMIGPCIVATVSFRCGIRDRTFDLTLAEIMLDLFGCTKYDCLTLQ